MSLHCFDDEPKSTASSVAGNTEPPKTAPALNVASPASAMSISRAVIAEEPSVPFILKFLSAVLTVSSTSLELFAISNIEVPPSFIVTFAPSAS